LFATPAIDGIVVTNTVPSFRIAPDAAAPRLTSPITALPPPETH